jgi:hypothetical protein
MVKSAWQRLNPNTRVHEDLILSTLTCNEAGIHNRTCNITVIYIISVFITPYRLGFVWKIQTVKAVEVKEDLRCPSQH